MSSVNENERPTSFYDFVQEHATACMSSCKECDKCPVSGCIYSCPCHVTQIFERPFRCGNCNDIGTHTIELEKLFRKVLHPELPS